MEHLENLAKSRAHELIQIGQDKSYFRPKNSVIQEELAESINQHEKDKKRAEAFLVQVKDLEEKLQVAKQEAQKMKQFCESMQICQDNLAGIQAQLQNSASGFSRNF